MADSTGGSKAVAEACNGQTSNLFGLAKSPINLNQLQQNLKGYPDRAAAVELENGFRFGFPLHYTGSRLPKESKNLKSADDHPDIIRKKKYKLR